MIVVPLGTPTPGIQTTSLPLLKRRPSPSPQSLVPPNQEMRLKMSVSTQSQAAHYTTLGPSLSFEVGIKGHIPNATYEKCSSSAYYQALGIIIISTPS